MRAQFLTRVPRTVRYKKFAVHVFKTCTQFLSGVLTLGYLSQLDMFPVNIYIYCTGSGTGTYCTIPVPTCDDIALDRFFYKAVAALK
jgi:hypothetical protein